MATEAAQTIDYGRRTLMLLGGLFVFRLIYAAAFATNPAGDEAYYWDWGRRPDYGYYSKPPLIAWIYALVDGVGGGHLFAIRAAAAVLGTGAIYLLYRFAASLFGPRTGWIAALLAAAAPANAVLSFFLTIDAPLVVCWTTALWMFWRMVAGAAGPATWILLFCALAIGHLGKQMMMVFPVLALVFLALTAETRTLLRRPSIWLVFGGSYLSLLPPLLWNARNGWITFQHTRHHFEATSDGGNLVLERLGDFLSFLGTQLGVLSPGTAFVVFSLSLAGLPRLARAGTPVRFLLVFGALPLAFMLLLALRQALQPNWAAVFYVSGLVLGAAWYSGRIESPFPPAAWRRLLPLTLAFGVALTGYFYAAPPVFEAIGKSGHKADPNRRQLGHDRLSAEVEKIRRSKAGESVGFLLTIGHRDLASHLAFGLPDQPRVYHLDTRPGVNSQYEMWPNALEDGHQGENALILRATDAPLPRNLARAFAKTEKIASFEVAYGYDNVKTFTVFLGRELRSWPEDSSAP